MGMPSHIDVENQFTARQFFHLSYLCRSMHRLRRQGMVSGGLTERPGWQRDSAAAATMTTMIKMKAVAATARQQWRRRGSDGVAAASAWQRWWQRGCNGRAAAGWRG